MKLQIISCRSIIKKVYSIMYLMKINLMKLPSFLLLHKLKLSNFWKKLEIIKLKMTLEEIMKHLKRKLKKIRAKMRNI
jgi:hypothetical protein